MKFTESKHAPVCFIIIQSFLLYEKLRAFDNSSVQVGSFHSQGVNYIDESNEDRSIKDRSHHLPSSVST